MESYIRLYRAIQGDIYILIIFLHLYSYYIKSGEVAKNVGK